MATDVKPIRTEADYARAMREMKRLWGAKLGTPDGDWVSMAVPSDDSYGIAPGVVYSYPCVCKGGDYQIVQGLSIDEFSRAKMDASQAELREERAAVESLLS